MYKTKELKLELTPRVFWAQRHEVIYLRVELTDAQNIDISVQENVLKFRAQGRGAKGDNQYEFSLAFLLPIQQEVSHRCTARQVDITVRKQQGAWWNRLTSQKHKPVFLSPDFDRWMDESDAEMEIRKQEERKNTLQTDSMDSEISFISLKKVLLFMYNLVQFLGFSWIFVNMTVRLFIFGQDSLYDTFHTIKDVMFLCQTLAAVEVLNAAFGVVKTGVGPVLIQVLGRNFILFIVLGSLEQMHNKPAAFFVFYMWSSVEIVRYPFYMLGCIEVEWETLTWLRYTVWIPLYPLGVLAEAVAVIQSIPIFHETNLFSIPLPSVLGSSLAFSYVLMIYLVLMPLGLFINFRHLYKQRMKRFPTKRRKAH